MSLLFALALVATAPAAPEVRLAAELSRWSAASGGRVGVAALHLETGRRVGQDEGERFPMASTYKVPLAVQVLSRVDRGEVRLEDRIDLRPGDLHPGSGLLSELFRVPGVSLSVRNLLELTLRESDNSATDKLFELAGGGAGVMARLRQLGIDGLDVSRPTIDLIADWAGLKERPATLEAWEQVIEAAPAEARAAAEERFQADPRDTSTPRAMVALLERVFRREALSAEGSDLLLDVMRRCRTGENRLRGLLPADTVVAHKTGTIGRATNDVGIVTLPDGAGHVAVAVFVKGSLKDIPARERVIAQIARALYDFYLFAAEPASPKQ